LLKRKKVKFQMSIQKQCVLRHRAEGYVRFELPAALCRRTVVPTVAAQIKAIDGVYRVNFYARQGKVSIRFQETVCDFTQLVKQLSELFSELENSGALIMPAKKPSLASKLVARISEKADKFAATRWMKAKTIEVKETLVAAKIISKFKPSDPEKATIGFLNDMLVIFLIRLHWDHITNLWMPYPFKYRNEWLATFYMFFLLIRSRRPR
jgi:hypothetical protein